VGVSFRPATLEDAEAFAVLRRLVTPYLVHTAAGIRHSWQHASPATHLLVVVAEDAGALVGAGRAALNTWTSTQGSATAMAWVHPEQRRRGIGGQVYDRLEEHLRGHGARQVQGWALADEATARWCQRRGFTRGHQARFSRLDLTGTGALPPIPPMPEGVSVATYAQVGAQAVYAVDAAALCDEPGDVSHDAVPYGEWLSDVWQRPETDHDASTVVLVNGVPAAITTVEADYHTRRMWSGGTGTLREHRGQGLAKLAKSVAIRLGRDPNHEAAAAWAAGLQIVDLRTARCRMEFFDIGAIVYILRKCVWWVPDFTLERNRDTLRQLDAHIRRHGGAFVAHSTRTLVEARRVPR
jgi:GNAT superfamily N-acetyltransferase